MNRMLLLLVCLCSLATIASGQAAIVINEAVYDSPGTDVDTWVELKGPGGTPLDGYRLDGFNGNGGVPYQLIPLDGKVIPADGYFLITEDPARPNSDMTTPDVDYQNGPDSIQLKQNQGGVWVTVDAVGYETHTGSDVFGGEGSACVGQVPPNSMARCPDGRDTNDNSRDFISDGNPTPGLPNAGTCAAVQGACCFVNGSCAILTRADCVAQGGTYQGDDTDCDPNPCVAVPEERTLCEIAADNPTNMRPALEGHYVHIQGLALNDWNQWSPTRIEFTITDGTCCTNVFWNNMTTPPVMPGDFVDVVGTVGFFNGKTQVTTPNISITILSSGNPLPTPTEVGTFDFAVNGENYESCLLKFRCVRIVGGDPWPPDGVDANILVDDGSGPTTLRIDKDTNVDGSPQPTGYFSVLGIGGQFDTTDPWSEGYQLNVRSVSDFVVDDCPAACCMPDGNCAVVDRATCEGQGGQYQGAGTNCDPNPCQQPNMACCFPDGHCDFISEAECLATGGVPQGFGSNCDPNPCPQPPQACCFQDGHCEFVTAEQCVATGGTPQGPGTNCDPNLCPQPPTTGACCFADGGCRVLTAGECEAAGGTIWIEGEDCDPNPCPPSATKSTTWGQIRASYR